MRRDEERFKWFVEDDEDWDDYLAARARWRVRTSASPPRLASMAESGTLFSRRWGGNLEFVAAANLRSVNVVVHQLEAPKFEICADDNSAARTVHLSYHGEAHYGRAAKRRFGAVVGLAAQRG